MCDAYNEKFEKRYNGSNRTAKSGNNQNARREGNYKYIGILEADTNK